VPNSSAPVRTAVPVRALKRKKEKENDEKEGRKGCDQISNKGDERKVK
jgi:hypothetical protein